MLSGGTASALARVGTAVFRIVVSSDSMKKATATSHGSNRFTSVRRSCACPLFGWLGSGHRYRCEMHLRPDPVLARKVHPKLPGNGRLRKRVGPILVGDIAQHACPIHGVEALDRDGERDLKLESYVGRSGSSGESSSRILRLGGSRPRQDGEESEHSEHEAV